MGPEIEKLYGNRVRARVCGLCWNGPELLMVNHHSLNDSEFWAPPGGGVEFGESAGETLKREFREETGLEVSVERFRFTCEFIKPPLHAVELFFEVRVKGGKLVVGEDPELPVIQDVRYLHFDEILKKSGNEVHAVFKMVKTRSQFDQLTGFFPI